MPLHLDGKRCLSYYEFTHTLEGAGCWTLMMRNAAT